MEFRIRTIIIFIVFFISHSTAIAESVTQDIFVNQDNSVWVTVEVWRDGKNIYADFTPSGYIRNSDRLNLSDFTILQNDKEYRNEVTGKGHDFDFLIGNDISPMYIDDEKEHTRIVTSAEEDIHIAIKFWLNETDLDLQKTFELKYASEYPYYQNYTLTIPANSDGDDGDGDDKSGGGGGGGGCFISAIQ